MTAGLDGDVWRLEDVVAKLAERVRVLEAQVASLQLAQPRGIPTTQAPGKPEGPK